MSDEPALLETIERYADEVVSQCGFDPVRRVDAHAEIVDHLLTAAERSSGPIDAQQLVRRFGSAPLIARQLRVQELKNDIRSAWRLPSLLLALVAADLIARVVTTAAGGNFAESALADRTARMVVACVHWTLAYWVSASALRLGHRWLARGIQHGAGSRVAAMGAVATLLAASTWIGLTPGFLSLQALAFLTYEQCAGAHIAMLMSLVALAGGTALEARLGTEASEA